MKFAIENSFGVTDLKDFDNNMKIKVFKELRVKLLNYITKIINKDDCNNCFSDTCSYLSTYLNLKFDLDYFRMRRSMFNLKRILVYANDHELDIGKISLYQKDRTITEKEIVFNLLIYDFILFKEGDQAKSIKFVKKSSEPEIFNLIESFGYNDAEIKNCYALDHKGESSRYFLVL